MSNQRILRFFFFFFFFLIFGFSKKKLKKFFETIKNSFSTLFARFKAKKHFSGQSVSVTFSCFWISLVVQNFRKKRIDFEKSWLQTFGHTDKYEFIRPPLSGVQQLQNH